MRSSYSMPFAFISATALAPRAVELLPEDDVRVLEDRLDHREHVERVGLALGRDLRQRVEEVERERVEEREVLLQPARRAHVGAAVALDAPQLDEPGARGASGTAARRARRCFART